MPIIDFANSYMTWFPHGGGNIARIQLDATYTIIDEQSGASETFYLIAPCRAERMYLDAPLFQLPNYEFCGIWSAQDPARFQVDTGPLILPDFAAPVAHAIKQGIVYDPNYPQNALVTSVVKLDWYALMIAVLALIGVFVGVAEQWILVILNYLLG